MANVGVIYIGTFLSADTDEGNWTNENDGVFAGTHGKTALRSLRIDVTTPQGDGVAYDDDLGQSASQITYDLGGGPVTALQDSVASYTVDILLGDGSTLSTVVNVIQLTDGATFINENSGGVVLDGLNIQSITLGTVVQDDASGWFTARSVDGAQVVCFGSGTRIGVPGGTARVEALRPGDLVETLDMGAQPVIWTARTRAAGFGATAPVRIAAGALGSGLPRSPLVVSPQHRILLRSPIVQRVVGHGEAFVAAKWLCGLPGIVRAPGFAPVSYHHVLLARHAVLLAEGAPAESFFPGPVSIGALSTRDAADLLGILERLKAPLALCRVVVPARRRSELIARHARNCQPLLRPRPLAVRHRPLGGLQVP